MTVKEATTEMESTFKGFEKYIRSLASGELDAFFDSLQPGNKAADLGVHLPHDPILLLHDLGKYPNCERIRELFSGNTVLVGSDVKISNADFLFLVICSVFPAPEKPALHSMVSARIGAFISLAGPSLAQDPDPTISGWRQEYCKE
jgi:hypothetical protein